MIESESYGSCIATQKVMRSLYQEINRHLSQCRDCQDWYERQTAFEIDLAESLRAGTPTATVWGNIEGSLPSAKRHETSWTLAAAAACLLLVFLGWRFVTPLVDSQMPDDLGGELTRLVSSCHQRLATGDEPLQFASQSDIEVEEFLKHRVAFPVRCPPRQDAGFEVRGGGVCSVGAAPAAYVHGLLESDQVSIFIFPRGRLADFSFEDDILRKQDVAYRRVGNVGMVMAKIDRNLVVVVGPERPEQLERVVRAYGTYPERDPHDAA